MPEWVCVLQGYDNPESSVRKACVFCLVAIYAVIGDDLKPHLSQLTGSKVNTHPSLSSLSCFFKPHQVQKRLYLVRSWLVAILSEC